LSVGTISLAAAAYTHWSTSSPVCGGMPVMISNRIAPIRYTSLAEPISSSGPVAISGAM